MDDRRLIPLYKLIKSSDPTLDTLSPKVKSKFGHYPKV